MKISPVRTHRRYFTRLAPIVSIAALFAAAPGNIASAQVAPNLNSAQSFAVEAGATITNTGPTVITGDLGLDPGSAVTGGPTVIGAIHISDAVSLAAKNDSSAVYLDLQGRACPPGPNTFGVPTDLGGMTLVPGVYCFASSAALTGTLTLNALGNPGAVWIFQIGSTLITAASTPVSRVLVTNGGQLCNVFWQVGSSATIEVGTQFVGSIFAFSSIALKTGAMLSGRAVADMKGNATGAVTMDSNTIGITGCAVPPVGIVPPTLGKAFSPATIDAGNTSLLTITLRNPNTTAASLNIPLVDTLPLGVVVAGAAATTCTGATATTGVASVTLTGGAIPANGSCTVTVPVTASAAGNYINSIAAGALQTNKGDNAAPAVATLTVNPVNPQVIAAPGLAKAFSPDTINQNGVSALTITLSNANPTAAGMTAPLVDALPIGVLVANPANTSNTCSGTFTAVPGASTVTLTGGSIPANGSCRVRVNVTAPVAGSYFNTLLAGALKTDKGDAATAVATLVVVAPTPAPALSLVKSANPMTYSTAGTLITYTYVLKNTGNVPLTGPFTVTDDKLGAFACGSASTVLAPGASFTCPTQVYTTQFSDLGYNATSLPHSANINTGAWLTFTNSPQDTKITGAGADVPNGTYACWCIQDRVPTDLHNQSAMLYSTIGNSLPSDVASLAWGKINYTLNHKIRGAGKSNLDFLKDVQTAVWALVGDPDPQFGVSAAAQQMIDAANANAGYAPSGDDIVAVIIYSDGMTVRPGSIQESICEMRARLKSIVNKATGKVAFGGGFVQSVQVQVTVTQVR